MCKLKYRFTSFFYSFYYLFQLIKAKRKDATLTKTWTKAIDRKNKDGSNWMPSKNHFICGKHFFSGRPSTNSRQGVIEA